MTTNLFVHKHDFSLRPNAYQPMHRVPIRRSYDNVTFYHQSMVYNEDNVTVVNDFQQPPFATISFELSLATAVEARKIRVENSLPSGFDGLGSVGDPRRK